MRASALTLPGNPFDVVTSGDGTSSFVSLNSSIAVLSDPSFLPRFISEIPIPGHPLGETLTHNGRYLLVADQSGAGVIKVAAAERGEANALLGVLRAPTQGSDGGAVEVTVSADDRYAFVTREAADDLAVFDLHRALLGGFAGGYFVGSVPLGAAPSGLALAPRGRWLYATSESRTVTMSVSVGGGRRLRPTPGAGILSVIDVARAESRPASAVLASVPAGNATARVLASADGHTVRVTARDSNSLLGFSARRLLAKPNHALVAQVNVGAALVRLISFRNDTRIVVADSNRFAAPNRCGSLTLVDANRALRRQSASPGVLPTGVFPRQMALEPAGKELLVTNYSSAQLEAVDISSAP